MMMSGKEEEIMKKGSSRRRRKEGWREKEEEEQEIKKVHPKSVKGNEKQQSATPSNRLQGPEFCQQWCELDSG